MNFTYVGGTPKQIRWVQDAIAECSYPLDGVSTSVTVRWVDPLPVSPDIGHAHSYMVTQQAGSQATISIASWADDPNHPDNQGLPNPAQDIYGFYKESVVHELGHVVQFTIVTADNIKEEIAGLFWTRENTGGSGRRYGHLADWDSTTWADNIKEAVAECFKCAAYTSPLVFTNRTNWRIDEKQWATLTDLLAPPGSTRTITPPAIIEETDRIPDPLASPEFYPDDIQAIWPPPGWGYTEGAFLYELPDHLWGSGPVDELPLIGGWGGGGSIVLPAAVTQFRTKGAFGAAVPPVSAPRFWTIETTEDLNALFLATGGDFTLIQKLHAEIVTAIQFPNRVTNTVHIVRRQDFTPTLVSSGQIGDGSVTRFEGYKVEVTTPDLSKFTRGHTFMWGWTAGGTYAHSAADDSGYYLDENPPFTFTAGHARSWRPPYPFGTGGALVIGPGTRAQLAIGA